MYVHVIHTYSMHVCIFISLKKIQGVAIQKEMTVIEVQIMTKKNLTFFEVKISFYFQVVVMQHKSNIHL